jgi:hypothetical protein
LAKETPHVTWIDNFSKIRAVVNPNMNSGTYKLCLWTGIAQFKYHGTAVISTLVKRTDGHILPIMPTKDELFADGEPHSGGEE